MTDKDYGRKVSGKRYVYYHGTPCQEDFKDGRFKRWGVDYTEFESGPANYTTAVVELPDGQVITTRPEYIKFGD